MSEHNFTFLACPVDLENPAPAVDWLTRATGIDAPKNVARFLAVSAKFKAPSRIRTFNIENNYPTEMAKLATHAGWSALGLPMPLQFRDARALFCMHRFLQAHPDAAQVVLIVEDPGKDNDLTTVLQSASSTRPFFRLGPDADSGARGGGQILFNRNHPDFEAAFSIALDMALTGAIYGLAPYSLGALLDQSTSAASIVTRASSATVGTGS